MNIDEESKEDTEYYSNDEDYASINKDDDEDDDIEDEFKNVKKYI